MAKNAETAIMQGLTFGKTAPSNLAILLKINVFINLVFLLEINFFIDTFLVFCLLTTSTQNIQVNILFRMNFH